MSFLEFLIPKIRRISHRFQHIQNNLFEFFIYSFKMQPGNNEQTGSMRFLIIKIFISSDVDPSKTATSKALKSACPEPGYHKQHISFPIQKNISKKDNPDWFLGSFFLRIWKCWVSYLSGVSCPRDL